MYRASYCNVYINQRDAQILVDDLYFFVKWLYMLLYSSQTYRHVPFALYSLLNVAPDDGLMIVRNM